jgi:hypothetical protein
LMAGRLLVEGDDDSWIWPRTSKTTENVENIRKLIHEVREFVPPKTTINHDFYCEILRRQRGYGSATTGPYTRTMSQLASPWNYRVCVRFEVFTAVTMKNGVFWDVTPCGSCKNRRFGGT